MQTDYSAVMNGAIALQEAGPDRDRREQLHDDYQAALGILVDGLLARLGKSAVAATRTVEQEFDQIAASSDATLAPVYDRVRYDIINRIGDVAGPTRAQQAWVTRMVGLVGVLAVVVFGVTYMGVRHFSATPVTAPIESKAGLGQRADALAKVLRYDALFSGESARSMVFKSIMFWPIEPTESEARNGRDFALVILEGARLLQRSHAACKLPAIPDATVTEEEVALVQDVVTRLRDPATQWQGSSGRTILAQIRARYPC